LRANASRRDQIVPVTPIANLGSDLPWMVDREAAVVRKRMLRQRLRKYRDWAVSGSQEHATAGAVERN
jgi:hypothetical protein